jgi:hypothetical protein
MSAIENKQQAENATEKQTAKKGRGRPKRSKPEAAYADCVEATTEAAAEDDDQAPAPAQTPAEAAIRAIEDSRQVDCGELAYHAEVRRALRSFAIQSERENRTERCRAALDEVRRLDDLFQCDDDNVGRVRVERIAPLHTASPFA